MTNCIRTVYNAISSCFFSVRANAYTPEAFIQAINNTTTLPSNIIVTGDVDLTFYNGPIELPEGLTIEGNLTLINCNRMTMLPRNLTIEGHLVIQGCTNLTSLPQNLMVKRSLTVQSCTCRSLPQDLIVEGDMYLAGLTSLPNWITTLGPCRDGKTRIINLAATNLSKNIIHRLRQAQAPGIEFIFPHDAKSSVETFSNLNDAFDFFVKKTSEIYLSVPSIRFDQQVEPVLNFLSQLTSTPEYQNLTSRPFLARRIIDLLTTIAQDDRARTIFHHLIALKDPVISSLRKFELMVRLDKIKNAVLGEEKLKELGKSFLLLKMVNEKAKALSETFTWVDEIEVLLAFQLGLAKRLNLPINPRNVLLRRCTQISDQQIEQAGTDILTACTSEKVDQFLSDWTPWKSHQIESASTGLTKFISTIQNSYSTWWTTYTPEAFIQAIKNGKKFSSNIVVTGDIDLSSYQGGIELPEEGLTVLGSLILRSTPVEKLPKRLIVQKDLDASSCPHLQMLTSDLQVGRELILSGCPLQSMRDELGFEYSLRQVNKEQILNGCPQVQWPLFLKLR